jgi:hypothetical protein
MLVAAVIIAAGITIVRMRGQSPAAGSEPIVDPEKIMAVRRAG